MSYTYNLAGMMTSETYPSGRIITTNPDAAGRINSVTGVKAAVSKTYAFDIFYAAHGAVRVMQLGNNLLEHTNFNERLQPSEIGLGNSSTSMSVLGLVYTYGGGLTNNGNVMSQTISAPSWSKTQNYQYTDPLNRLTSAYEDGGVSWAQNYSYDRYGNRWVASGSYLPNGTLTPQSQNSFNAGTNKLTGGQWSYLDGTIETGNLTRDNMGNIYSYDLENRLISFNGSVAEYSYDGDGRRVKKEEGGATTTFVYNVLGQLIAEYGGQLATIATSYITADHLGSTRVITDGTQAVTARFDYLPFGEEIPSGVGGRTAAMGYGVNTAVKHKFTGKERDAESGLDYFGARYFSGAQGRFTTTDPLLNSGHPAEPQSWNRYAYVSNNPLRFTDPTGLFKWAANCDEASDSACKAERDRFRSALENAQKAATNLEKGSKERKQLEKALKRIGEEGKGSVRIAFGDAGTTDSRPNLGLTVGNKITLNFNAVDQLRQGFQLNFSEAASLDAGLVAHEGEHAGAGPFAFSFLTMSRERTALFTESYTYQGLRNTDRVFSLWNESWRPVDKLTLDKNRQRAIQNILNPPKEQKPENPQ